MAAVPPPLEEKKNRGRYEPPRRSHVRERSPVKAHATTHRVEADVATTECISETTTKALDDQDGNPNYRWAQWENWDEDTTTSSFFLDDGVRSAKNDCGSRWTRTIDIYRRSRLLHRLTPDPDEDISILETVEDERSEESDDGSASSTLSECPRQRKTPHSHPMFFFPRRLHSSGSQWTLSGTSVARKIVSHQPV